MSYAIVGEQILKYRKAKGLTQRELGEAIGVSSSAVSQWESGGTPDISLLPALSDVLGVTVDALFGRTEARREDMEENVAKYIASLPEEKRMERLVSTMRKAMIYGCTDQAADLVNFDRGDSEMIYVAEDGFATSSLYGGQSFLFAGCNGTGSFAELLSAGDETVQLFSVLASSHALMLLTKLYSEVSKYRTVGALAKLSGIPQAEAEEILQKFTDLKLTEELELETEDGVAKAYAVNANGAVVPLLAAAHLAAVQTGGFRIINDKRPRGKGRR